MLVVQDSNSIAANATNANVIANTRLEFAPEDGMIDIYVNGSALGLDVRALIDGNEVIERTSVNAQNRFPVVPDDILMGSVEVLAGQKVTIEISNTTAGALTEFHRVELTAIEFEA